MNIPPLFSYNTYSSLQSYKRKKQIGVHFYFKEKYTYVKSNDRANNEILKELRFKYFTICIQMKFTYKEI